MKESINYNMQGMSSLLHMYGQAGGAAEEDVKKERSNIQNIKAELDKLKEILIAETQTDQRHKLKKTIKNLRDNLVLAEQSLLNAKLKMKEILRNASKTTRKAANSLNDSIKYTSKKNDSTYSKSNVTHKLSELSKLSRNVSNKSSGLSNGLKSLKIPRVSTKSNSNITNTTIKQKSYNLSSENSDTDDTESERSDSERERSDSESERSDSESDTESERSERSKRSDSESGGKSISNEHERTRKTTSDTIFTKLTK